MAVGESRPHLIESVLGRQETPPRAEPRFVPTVCTAQHSRATDKLTDIHDATGSLHSSVASGRGLIIAEFLHQVIGRLEHF